MAAPARSEIEQFPPGHVRISNYRATNGSFLAHKQTPEDRTNAGATSLQIYHPLQAGLLVAQMRNSGGFRYI
jgi:hypothetical protein